ncbi:hypothetical protein D3C84_488030 [compost metagenome]
MVISECPFGWPPFRLGVVAQLPVPLGLGLQVGIIEIAWRLVITALTQQAPPQQVAQLRRHRQRHVVIAILLSQRWRRRHLSVDVLLELIDGQHTLSDGRSVEPVNVIAAIKLIECLQIIPTLQRQDRAFPLDAALGLKRFEIPVRCPSLAPGFILREGLGSLGVRGGGSRLITLAHRQFRPQPPRQATVAGVFKEGLGAGVIALLIIHGRQPISIVEAAARAVLQQLDQFLLARRLITK